MALSTNSVFHFTPKKSYFNSILKDGGFKIKFCFERNIFDYANFAVGIPMVSFCDIPLSQAFDHIFKYGSYAIGLSKDWASKNGLNPVFYIEKQSVPIQMIEPFLLNTLNNDPYGDINVRYLIDTAEDDNKEKKDVFTGDRALNINATISIISYIKNHEGSLIRSGKRTVEKYRFYDEREWRYIPTHDKFEQAGLEYIPLLTIDEYDQIKGLNPKERFLPDLLLNFKAKDIDYLLVKNEREIPNTIKQLKRAKHLFDNEDEYLILVSRLTSIERILKDL